MKCPWELAKLGWLACCQGWRLNRGSRQAPAALTWPPPQRRPWLQTRIAAPEEGEGGGEGGVSTGWGWSQTVPGDMLRHGHALRPPLPLTSAQGCTEAQRRIWLSCTASLQAWQAKSR